MIPLGRYLHKLTAPTFKRFGFCHTKILADWPQIVGIKLAQSTTPKKIIYYKETSILYIETTNSSSATELCYNEPMIIEKLSIYLGSKVISKLKVIQNPATINNNSLPYSPNLSLNTQQDSQLCSLIDSIADNDLKSVLYQLGVYIYSSNNDENILKKK